MKHKRAKAEVGFEVAFYVDVGVLVSCFSFLSRSVLESIYGVAMHYFPLPSLGIVCCGRTSSGGDVFLLPNTLHSILHSSISANIYLFNLAVAGFLSELRPL